MSSPPDLKVAGSSAATPDLPDHSGVEFILATAAANPDEELVLDLSPKCSDARCADVLRDLRLNKAEIRRRVEMSAPPRPPL